MNAPPLFAQLLHTDADSCLVVVGEVDIEQAPALHAELERAIEITSGTLVVDLTGVSFIASAGLHVLLDAWSTLRDRHRSMVTVPSPPARRLFEITGVEHLIGDVRATKSPRSARTGSLK